MPVRVRRFFVGRSSSGVRAGDKEVDPPDVRVCVLMNDKDIAGADASSWI